MRLTICWAGQDIELDVQPTDYPGLFKASFWEPKIEVGARVSKDENLSETGSWHAEIRYPDVLDPGEGVDCYLFGSGETAQKALDDLLEKLESVQCWINRAVGLPT